MKSKKFKVCTLSVLGFFYVCGLNLLSLENRPIVAEVPDHAHLSIGCGYGLHYGSVGLSFEFNPRLPARFGNAFHNYASFGLGFGIIPGGGLSYSFGLRFYPLGRQLFLQPRLSVSYGVVAVVDELYVEPGAEHRSEGVAFSAGLLVKLTRFFSLDADAHVILPVDFDMDELQGGRFRFSVGLRYRMR